MVGPADPLNVGKAAKVASKELLDDILDINWIYTAPAHSRSYSKIMRIFGCREMKNQDFIWGRLVEEFGFRFKNLSGGNRIGPRACEW